MKKQTLAQAIKAVRAYAISKGESYFLVTQSWQSIYGQPQDGELKFTAYINGFGAHFDSPNIEGLIKQFDAVNHKVTPSIVLDDNDLVF